MVSADAATDDDDDEDTVVDVGGTGLAAGEAITGRGIGETKGETGDARSFPMKENDGRAQRFEGEGRARISNRCMTTQATKHMVPFINNTILVNIE